MNTPPLPSILLAALLFSSSVLAQQLPRSKPSVAASDREDRHCTSSALSADPTAPCSDDAVIDRPRTSRVVVRPPAKKMAGNRNPGTSIKPVSNSTGKASTSALGTSRAESTGNTMGMHQ